LQAGNICVKHELFHYAFYWHHLKSPRPAKDTAGSAVRILLERLYGSEKAAVPRQYRNLQQQAYPLIKTETPSNTQ